MCVTDGHFEDIIHFLITRATPKGYSVQKNRELVVWMVDFSIIVGHLYNMGTTEILRGYVPEFKRTSILANAHVGAVGGHYLGIEITQNILHVGLWLLTIYQDSKAYCKACHVCQRTCRPSQRDVMPLNPQITLQPFEKWEIYFVGPIYRQWKIGARYIVTATEF